MKIKPSLAIALLAALAPAMSRAEGAPTAALLALTRDGEMLRIDAPGGAPTYLGSTGLADVLALERGADGVYYAVAGWNRLYALDPSTGRTKQLAALPYNFVADLAHEPGGRRLLAAADVDGIGEAEFLIEIDPVSGTNASIGPFEDPADHFDVPSVAFGLAFAPDATLYGSLSVRSPDDALIAAIDPATGIPYEGVSLPGFFSGLDFGPDEVLYGVERVFAGSAPGSFAVAIDPVTGAVTRLSDVPLGLERSPGDCANGLDDDGDGATDAEDTGCVVSALEAESATPDCANGADDDGDGAIDLADPGCRNAGDPSERALGLPCDDGLDNDGDTAVDATGSAGAGPDPECGGSPLGHESGGHCGLGGELVLVLAPIARRLASRRDGRRLACKDA